MLCAGPCGPRVTVTVPGGLTIPENNSSPFQERNNLLGVYHVQNTKIWEVPEIKTRCSGSSEGPSPYPVPGAEPRLCTCNQHLILRDQPHARGAGAGGRGGRTCVDPTVAAAGSPPLRRRWRGTLRSPPRLHLAALSLRPAPAPREPAGDRWARLQGVVVGMRWWPAALSGSLVPPTPPTSRCRPGN